MSSNIHSEAHVTLYRSKGQANLAAGMACLSWSPRQGNPRRIQGEERGSRVLGSR